MDSQWLETALKLGGCDCRNIGSRELDLTLKLGPPGGDGNHPSHFIGTEGTNNHGKVGDGIAEADKGTNNPSWCCCYTTSKQGGAIGLSPKIGTYFHDTSRYTNSNGPVLMGNIHPAAYPSYPAFNGFQYPPPAGSSQLLIVPPMPYDDKCNASASAGVGRKVVDLERKKSQKRGSSPRNDTVDLGRRCMNSYCNTCDTPMWRKGPLGPKTLCNACGIKYRKEEERRKIRSKAAAINNKINCQPGSMQG